MTLKTDEAGEDNIMKAFIMVFAMIMLLTFVISGLTRLGNSAEVVDNLYPGGAGVDIYQYETLGADDLDGRFINISGLEGYQVSSADVIDQICYPTHEDPFIFEDSEGDQKYVHVIRDNVRYDPDSTNLWEMYNNYISIRRESGGISLISPAFGIAEMSGWDNAAIPFGVMAENYDNETHVCTLNFTLSGRSDNIMLRTPDADDTGEFLQCLYNDNYTIHYGWSLLRMDERSFWGTVQMIFWDDIPGMNPYVEFIFHSFMIGVTAFIIFVMGVRLWDAVVPL